MPPLCALCLLQLASDEERKQLFEEYTAKLQVGGTALQQAKLYMGGLHLKRLPCL